MVFSRHGLPSLAEFRSNHVLQCSVSLTLIFPASPCIPCDVPLLALLSRTQDITIRRLEDKIAELEEKADAKAEEEAEARLKELQEVQGERGGTGYLLGEAQIGLGYPCVTTFVPFCRRLALRYFVAEVCCAINEWCRKGGFQPLPLQAPA